MAQTLCRPAVLRWLAYTLLLFASWNFNLLAISDPAVRDRAEPRTGHLGLEANLVISRVVVAGQRPALYPLVYKSDDGTEYIPYRSQLGLVGIVLGGLKSVLPVSSAVLLRLAASLLALLTAGALAAVFARAGRWLPPVAGDVACALAAVCPVFLTFAPSLYTQLLLLLGPFIVAWCLGPWATTRTRRAILLAAVGLAVTAKALAGYEYITTVILAPTAAAWFHQTRAACGFARKLGGAAAVVGVGLLGFALALALHVVQVRAILDQDGRAFVQGRATERTAGDPGPGADSDARTFRYAAAKFLEYGEMPVLTLPAVPAHVRRAAPLKLLVGLAAAVAAGLYLSRRRLTPSATGIAGATLIGLAAGLSWQVLAVNHMCAHHHLNLVVFAVPFLPLAFLLFGTILGSLGAGSRAGIALLVGVAILMAVTGARAAVRDRAGAAIRAEAEWNALAAAQSHEVRDPRVSGCVDRVERAGDLDRYMILAIESLNLDTDRAADPDGVILHGWASAGVGLRDDVLTELVVIRGAEVVPCRVLRLRRADLDRQAGKPVRDAGFAVCVPSWAVQGERPRLFAVSRADPSRVTEVPIPWK